MWSRSSRGQGHQSMCPQKGNVPRNVVLKYEVNMLSNKEVMANVKVFGRNDRLTDGQTDRQTDRRTDGRTSQKLYASLSGA